MPRKWATHLFFGGGIFFGLQVRILAFLNLASWSRKDYATDHICYVRFGSVHHHAKVWVNGDYVGEHSGGHLPFEFEVDLASMADREQGSSWITVAVNNTLTDSTLPQGKVHIRIDTNRFRIVAIYVACLLAVSDQSPVNIDTTALFAFCVWILDGLRDW